jgi:hypothetical protein
MLNLKSLMTLVLAAVVFFQMGPAHAYLGVKSSQTEEKIAQGGMSLNPALAAGGFLGLGAGGAAGGTASIVWMIAIGAAVVAVVAVFLVLDEDGNANFYYQAVSEQDGQALGLTLAEVKAFNQNVDMINAVMDELRWGETQDYASAWNYFADELGWDQTLRNAVAKMSYHLQQSLVSQ